MKFLSACLLWLFLSSPTMAQSLIPIPVQMTTSPKGHYLFKEEDQILISDSLLLQEARELQSVLRKRTGYPITIRQSKFKKKHIYLDLDKQQTNPEGYQLSITPEYIRISSPTPAGIFYGIQTLDQYACKQCKQDNQNDQSGLYQFGQ